MAIAGNITVALRAQTSQFDSALKKSSRRVSGWSKSVKTAVSYATQAFAAYKVYDFAKSSVSAFMEEEDALNNLSSALAVMGKYSEASMTRAKDFAAEIQKTTTVADDAVLSLMQLGASMGQLAGKDLERATVAAIGLSRAFKIDTTAAMKMVAKASMGNTDTLGKYGIVLDESLTRQEKFNEVLKIGEKNFQLAQREIDTTAGKLKQLSNVWGDMKEVIGGAILSILKPIEAMLSKLVDVNSELARYLRTANTGLKSTPEELRISNEYSKQAREDLKAYNTALALVEKQEETMRGGGTIYYADRIKAINALKSAAESGAATLKKWEVAPDHYDVGVPEYIKEYHAKFIDAAQYATKELQNAQKTFVGGLSEKIISSSEYIFNGLNKVKTIAITVGAKLNAVTKSIANMKKRASQIYIETRTPKEVYDKEMNQLNKLMSMKYINGDTFDRASKQAMERYKSAMNKDSSYRDAGFGQAVGYRNTPNMPQNTQQTMTIQRQQTSLLGEIKNATRETANALKKPASSVTGGGFTQ